MIPGYLFFVVVFTPVATVTLAVLVAAVALAVTLSVVIARRDPTRRSVAPVSPSVLPRTVVASRPTVAQAPVDMQERLRRLTSSLDLATEDARAGGLSYEAAPLIARSYPHETPATPATPADDATRFFGEEGVGMGESGDPDATTFFAEPIDVRGGHENGHVQDDATRFFGDPDGAGEGAGLPAPDATTFFGEAPSVEREEQGDVTRFFGSEEAASPEGAETLFFSPEELAIPLSSPDDSGVGPGVPAQLLPASPPVPPGTGALDRVRALLNANALPDVLAISIVDSAGRALAGETDADFTDELRSLMAESGQGNVADVEQPVVLADDAPGAILLVPTGANVLLGALVTEGGDPHGTRTLLRKLALEIGDALNLVP